jgi:5-methylcytosine-specific restriction endonuclease McrA
MVNYPVLVLNQNYEPLNISRVRRAVVLLLRGKAEALENGRGVIHTPSCSLTIPSVIRILYMVKRPHSERKLTRIEVLRRDQFACQYCGKETRELTLDHVIPRHKGGKHIWENVVGACSQCNSRKAGRTPKEAGLRLIRQPFTPRISGYYVPYEYLLMHAEWHKFLPLWQREED